MGTIFGAAESVELPPFKDEQAAWEYVRSKLLDALGQEFSDDEKEAFSEMEFDGTTTFKDVAEELKREDSFLLEVEIEGFGVKLDGDFNAMHVQKFVVAVLEKSNAQSSGVT